jgi:hypothetical protein
LWEEVVSNVTLVPWAQWKPAHLYVAGDLYLVARGDEDEGEGRAGLALAGAVRSSGDCQLNCTPVCLAGPAHHALAVAAMIP